MIAQVLTLPAEGLLIDQAEIADIDSIHSVREFTANMLANNLEGSFEEVFKANSSNKAFKVDAESIAQRALKNLALAYLVRTDKDNWIEDCYRQFEGATNMTDQLAALRC